MENSDGEICECVFICQNALGVMNRKPWLKWACSWKTLPWLWNNLKFWYTVKVKYWFKQRENVLVHITTRLEVEPASLALRCHQRPRLFPSFWFSIFRKISVSPSKQGGCSRSRGDSVSKKRRHHLIPGSLSEASKWSPPTPWTSANGSLVRVGLFWISHWPEGWNYP